MVSYINQLQRQGMSKVDSIFHGALSRLRTVLMTALLAMLGLLPMALSQGIGAETQRPLALVVIGGLISATVLTLFVLPALCHFIATHPRLARGAALSRPSGPPGTARRWSGWLALWLLLGACRLTPAATLSDDEVEVDYRDGAYFAHLQLRVAVPQALALAVLTDFEQMPAFMPGLEQSRVLGAERTTLACAAAGAGAVRTISPEFRQRAPDRSLPGWPDRRHRAERRTENA